jgi:hypothetical protein
VIARLLVLTTVLLIAGAPAAVAQDNPFGPIPPAPPEQTAPPEDSVPDSPNPDDDGLSSRQQLLILLAAIIMIGGIAWFILRDARRSAPVEHHRTEAEGGTKSKGTRTPKEARVAQQRARAKAARRARKKQKKR